MNGRWSWNRPGNSGAAAIVFFLSVALGGCERAAARMDADPAGSPDGRPHVTADSDVEAGRYLVTVAGCNDCHTDGWMETEGDVAEADWLTGSQLGWRGPWGTTYPANLRLRASELTEDQWVEQLHTRSALPPMPWMNVRHLSDRDARAIHRYLVSMGSAGERVPAALPPGQEPAGPYLLLEPVMSAGS